MIKLVSKTNVLPRHLFITDLEIEPQAVAVGGFGRVFKGKCGGQPVALKMLYQKVVVQECVSFRPPTS